MSLSVAKEKPLRSNKKAANIPANGIDALPGVLK